MTAGHEPGARQLGGAPVELSPRSIGNSAPPVMRSASRCLGPRENTNNQRSDAPGPRTGEVKAKGSTQTFLLYRKS